MDNPISHDEEIAPIPNSPAVELQTSATKTAKDSDPFLVNFRLPYDPENPLDWPTARKWRVTDILSATGFNRIMVSTIMAPALSTIAQELDMNSTESAMSLSIYLLATAFGPLFIGPLSELYGRQVILHASNIWFLVWNLVCGFAHTKGTLIAARFLAGFGASAIYALAGGVLGDIWRPEQRGRSLGTYLLIPLLGAAVGKSPLTNCIALCKSQLICNTGPIIGGFITARTTWRWMFWATSIFQTVMIAVSFFSFHESYGALLLRRRADNLRRRTGNTQYYTAAERLDGNRSAIEILWKALTRPLRLLFFHPIIQVSATLSGLNYGIMYITLSTFSDLWTSQYHESIEISGLHYIACASGELVASQIGGPLMDFLYNRQKNDNPSPESRLRLMYPGILAAWLGVLLYGWAADYRLFWLVVDIGVVIMMFGMQLGGMPSRWSANPFFVFFTDNEHSDGIRD